MIPPPSEQSGASDPESDALRAALSGRYDVERELGRGGMATVYLARDRRHGRDVAVKVMQRDVVAPESSERFTREIQTAARLTHPHVLGVYDSGEADGLLYYVMPYVEGETLRARLARGGALPIVDAVRLMRELADALAHAHAHGIVHRDLKPENVLLSGGHAVVADFGIAKALAATRGDDESHATLTATGVSLGTPAYMAPEQMIGARDVDHRADLYALGVVAYEMLAGTHPFGARTPQALAAAVFTENPAPLAARRPDVPPAVSALITQLMAKDASDRPQNAEALLRAIDSLGTSRIPSPSRVRGIRVAGVAALVVVALTTSYTTWRQRASRASPPQNVIHTLAVLPFVNTSHDASDDYFSDGLTDELAHALARLPGLRIAGRTSSYAFKGKSVAAAEIGRALDVSALVEGTVQRAGDRLRVTTQLVGTNDGKVLWDTLYESQSSDVFGVQDQFTRAVAAALRPSLGDRPADSLVDVGRGTTDQEAYELYLKGRYYWMARGSENVERSIDYFKQALARDPTFARAEAGLALAYVVLPVWVPDPLDTVPALLAASAGRAMKLDSTLADAQSAYAQTLEGDLRFAEAVTHYRKAIALEPSNATAHQEFGLLLLELGHTGEAIRETNIGAQLDPLAKSNGTALGLALSFARRFPETIAAARRVLAIDSTYVLALQELATAYLFGGHPDSAVSVLEREERIRYAPAQRITLLLAYAAAGRRADADRVRTELHRPGGDLSGGVDAAFADYVFGNREPLVQMLMTERGQRRWLTNHFGCNPLLDPLWANARFRAATRGLTIEPCQLAKPWPIEPRPSAAR